MAYAETDRPIPDNLAGAFNVIVRYRLISQDAAAIETGAGSRAHLSNARTGTFGLSPDKARNLVRWIGKQCGRDLPTRPEDRRKEMPMITALNFPLNCKTMKAAKSVRRRAIW